MKRLLLVAILIIAACSSLALSQTSGVDTKTRTSRLAGTWKANLAKSQRDPNHQFQSLTLHFEVSGDAVSLAYSGVNMSGEEESGAQRMHPDGKQYRVAEAPGVAVITKWLGPDVLETVAKKDGKVVGQGTYEVSGDGRTLTARIKGIDASGGSFEQVVVLERQ
jgi:hypothetical protein